MSISLFIAGTDTNVGKTYTSVGLLTAFNQLGFSTLGLKPIASGCNLVSDTFYSEDALALKAASSIQLNYEHINPFAYGPAIAPHLAAEKIHSSLNVIKLVERLHPALQTPADIHLIEGAGGWHVPLNQTETFADFVMHQRIPVILVVGLRLGCLNHAILTYKAMQQNNVRLLGWIGNSIDPAMEYKNENILSLQQWLPVPCFGVIQHQEPPQHAIQVAQILQHF